MLQKVVNMFYQMKGETKKRWCWLPPFIKLELFALFWNFSFLCHENNKYLLELKKAPFLSEIVNQWIKTYIQSLSIYLKKFLKYYFSNWRTSGQFPVILSNLLDVRINYEFSFLVCEMLWQWTDVFCSKRVAKIDFP